MADTFSTEERSAIMRKVKGKGSLSAEPTQNAFVERCNGNIRRELLNVCGVFKTMEEVRTKAEE